MTVNDQDPYSQDPLDSDPDETAEWKESLQQLVQAKGHGRGREIMLKLLQTSHELQLNVPMVPTTDYINTIPPENEPDFPGDEEIERRYRALDPLECRRDGAPGAAARASAWAATSPPTLVGVAVRGRLQPLLPRARTTPAAATRSSSRATPPPASTPAPSSRAGSPRSSWTASGRRSPRRPTASRPTRTRG